MFPTCRTRVLIALCVLVLLCATTGYTADLTTPEGVLRALVRANEDKDMATIAKFMAHDADIISYTIEGRKYVGWPDFARDMENEFKDATRIEIPITELKLWTRGDTAWFAMELDYIRYLGSGKDEVRMLLPLRETGIMERRNGQWVLITFHESFRSEVSITPGVSSSNQAFPSLK